MTIAFPLAKDFFDGGASLSAEKILNLLAVLNQLGVDVKTLQDKQLPIVSSVGVDNSSSPTQILAAAGHRPGMYLVYRYLIRRTAGSAGNIVTTVNWHDPVNGALTSSNSQTVVGTVPSFVNPGAISTFSDGTTDLSVAITWTGITGVPVFDVRSFAVFQRA